MWTEVSVRTERRVQVIDVTERIIEICRRRDLQDGLVIVVCQHTTAGLCVNEGDARLHRDLEAWLERVVPTDGSYAHNAGDDNADAHLRAVLLGHNACVPLHGGQLTLGAWQRILFVELDGPRSRTLSVAVIGETATA